MPGSRQLPFPLDKGHERARRLPMRITKKAVANKLAAYLCHGVSLDDLVKWAEHAMLEGAFAEKDAEIIASVVAQLGIADVRAFGLTWEECEAMLKRLGFAARVEIVTA
jgi:hypothetical protein